MTVVAVVVDPPRDGLVLPALPDETPLSAGEATRLYEAMVSDALLAAAESGGDLLVNYRSDEQLPDEHVPEDADAEAEVRALVEDVLDDDQLGDVRIEVQVGSSRSARVGNTVAHLLETEDAGSVAVLEPDVPTLFRKDVDSAAMKLRRSETVLGPADDGDLYFAGFKAPVDFEGALETPALENVNARAVDAGHDVDFLATRRRVRSGGALRTLVSELRARRASGRLVPAYTTALVEDLGLRVDGDEDGEPTLVTE
ncbi:DUF2064 domain-containing protein [Halobacterium jilantaiense]|uniref:DUF2064 domain-containing protein n=1 Tax=Halobacterium jilantaiense TaxID=355548 RepID=A0A1I0MIE1_9EURY|nr:DUF2064 domain-containing protein [Halobacterium jilantaiense]SEV87540.1 hypothetical protein SAMN04487945_0055 [Halobacterium jilantaiense]